MVVELPANAMVWLCSPEADFLRGRTIWANWDVNELKEKSKEWKDTDVASSLKSGLVGWPQ